MKQSREQSGSELAKLVYLAINPLNCSPALSQTPTLSALSVLSGGPGALRHSAN